MQNRRERRMAEKQMGLHKLEKTMSKAQLDEIKKRKREYVKQLLLLKAQEDENRRINEEAERWSKELTVLMESGYTREEATEVMDKNKKIQDERDAKKAARKAEKTAIKTA
jgi:hypothetical protein